MEAVDELAEGLDPLRRDAKRAVGLGPRREIQVRCRVDAMFAEHLRHLKEHGFPIGRPLLLACLGPLLVVASQVVERRAERRLHGGDRR